MKAESHQLLGLYLAEKYLDSMPRRYVKAFLLGCVEPDKNPTTYLKGSIRCQWLRGHNWGNAQRYMKKVCDRLERRRKLRLLDYYTIGKLIHYTMDAFTYAHNEGFRENLRQHCSYERVLHDYLSEYMKVLPESKHTIHDSVMDAIRSYHRDYDRNPTGIQTDAWFCVTVCCIVLALLLAKHTAFLAAPRL